MDNYSTVQRYIEYNIYRRWSTIPSKTDTQTETDRDRPRQTNALVVNIFILQVQSQLNVYNNPTDNDPQSTEMILFASEDILEMEISVISGKSQDLT